MDAFTERTREIVFEHTRGEDDGDNGEGDDGIGGCICRAGQTLLGIPIGDDGLVASSGPANVPGPLILFFHMKAWRLASRWVGSMDMNSIRVGDERTQTATYSTKTASCNSKSSDTQSTRKKTNAKITKFSKN